MTDSQTHEVTGGGGLRLHVREWGDREAPSILFVHGWSQSDLCWGGQVASPLARDFHLVSFDLRGHGMSDRPRDPEHYTDPQLWAQDVAAVIAATELDRPVVVAWSYGGFVVCDYIREYGEQTIAGVDLVGGAVVLRQRNFEHIGPTFLENAPDACGPDLRHEHRRYRAVRTGLYRRPARARRSRPSAVLEHGRRARGAWRADLTRDR